MACNQMQTRHGPAVVMEGTEAQREPHSGKVTVWGLAAGTRSTAEAARGALAWREYPDRHSIPRDDWQTILFIRNTRTGEDADGR